MENFNTESINPGDGNLDISEIMEMNNVTKDELSRLGYMIKTQESLRELITHEYADLNKGVISPYKIEDLQMALNKNGSIKIPVNGVFSTQTFMAIVSYQKENGFSSSGMIQTEMKNKLFKNYKTQPTTDTGYDRFMQEITGDKIEKQRDIKEIETQETSDYEDFMEELLGEVSYKETPKTETNKSYEDFMKTFDVPDVIRGGYRENQGDLRQLDLRSLAKKYPNEASLKNNNPAGITYFPEFANTLTRHGVDFYKGTPRPRGEGRNYFGFNNMEDGMKALDILWNIKLQNLAEQDFSDFAKNWAVDTRSYRSEFGNIWNTKMKDLPPHEIERIKLRQMRIESPGMYTELKKLDII